MLTLFDYGPSQNAWKVRELLRRLGTPYHSEPVSIFEGAGQAATHLARNPTGQVPAIALDDGTVCGESNAILLLLAEGTTYLPVARPARGRVLQWLFFEQNALESSLGTLRYWTLTGKLGARHPAVVDLVRARSRRSLQVLERGLAGDEFVAGPFSIADIALYAYGHAAAEAGLELVEFPRVAAWAERVRAHEGPLSPVIPYQVDPSSGGELP
jgi:glutathione S-transferase